MNYDKIAISFGRTKEAILYFDCVIPVYLAVDVLPEFIKTKSIGPGHLGFLADLFPNNLQSVNFALRLGQLNMASFNLMWKLLAQRVGQPPQLEGMTDADWETVEERAATAYYGFLGEFDLTDIPVVSASSAIMDSESNSGDVALTLSTLELVDVSKASWEQLVEFRKDVEAKQKLRRLRLFAAENYDGKSRAYVEDDLHRRIYDYEEEARRWGFETMHAVLTMLVTSKTLGASLGGSFISALFGAPAVSVASAITGSCIEFGRIALEVSRRRFVLRNAMRDNPVSYIEDAKTKLTKDA